MSDDDSELLYMDDMIFTKLRDLLHRSVETHKLWQWEAVFETLRDVLEFAYMRRNRDWKLSFNDGRLIVNWCDNNISIIGCATENGSDFMLRDSDNDTRTIDNKCSASQMIIKWLDRAMSAPSADPIVVRLRRTFPHATWI
jgi:hypothetical protein